MIAGTIGTSSPGQFAPGAISNSSLFSGELLPAPADRTFTVPQNGLCWEGYKTPENILNFSFNWANEIGDDLIVSSVWKLESTDIIQIISDIDETGTITTTLLSNGVAANIYNVTNLVTTASGVTLDATFRLFVTAYNTGC